MKSGNPEGLARSFRVPWRRLDRMLRSFQDLQNDPLRGLESAFSCPVLITYNRLQYAVTDNLAAKQHQCNCYEVCCLPFLAQGATCVHSTCHVMPRQACMK